MDISIINTFRSLVKKLKTTEVEAAVEAENEGDLIRVEALEVIVVAKVVTKPIVGLRVEVVQKLEIQRVKVIQEVEVVRKVEVFQRVRAEVKVGIKVQIKQL
jgi:hypothetical protein